MKLFPFQQRFNLSRFLRGFGPELGPIELNRRRIYILPTKQGLMFGLLLVILLLGSMNYNNSLGFALTFLLASLGNLSILYTYRNLAGLKFEVGKIEPCFAGEPLSFHILVTNNSDYDHFAVQIETADDERVFDIQAREQQSILLHAATFFRGRFPLERLNLSTRFPMGLFRAWAYVHFDHAYLVYPQPQDVRDPEPADGYGLSQQGDRGRGSDDFVGFRNFQIGDSPRRIYWKKSTHEQAPITKQFGGDRLVEHWFDWRMLHDLPIEKRISQLCQWILVAEHRQESYGLRLPDKEFALGKGIQHQMRCLTELALLPHG